METAEAEPRSDQAFHVPVIVFGRTAWRITSAVNCRLLKD
jgi:hypothetical protein